MNCHPAREASDLAWAVDVEASYLRLAEKSVTQLTLQSCDWRRSAATHIVNPIRTITVTTSLAKMLSLTNPPQ
jgi:hypothetical protein